MDRSVLVLGATGFVGRQVLVALEASPSIEVIVGCRSPDSLKFEGEIRVGDLRDPTYRATVFEGVHTVCFAAAWSALYGHATESRERFFEPVEAAMQAAVEAGVQRIVFTSSVDVGNIDGTNLPHVAQDLRSVWPHLANVRALEEVLRTLSARCEVIVLRFGIFIGEGVGIGILPALLPRLRWRLVPYIDGGNAPLRLVDGRDIGRAFAQAVQASGLAPFEVVDIVGPSPTFRALMQFLSVEFDIPVPWFSVPAWAAFRFAHAAELLSAFTPWEPLITRGLVFLLEPFTAGGAERIGFEALVPWQDSVRRQVKQIHATGHPGGLVNR